MKLLLTSGGLTNQTIIDTLVDLLDRPLKQTRVAFIPTASTLDLAGKAYSTQSRLRLKRLGFLEVKSVDIAKLPKSAWLSNLENTDLIYVNGGNTTYLMNCFNESGLSKEIPRLLKDKVYVGVSAGSYIATPDIRFNTDNVTEILQGLQLVEFGLQVHLNSPRFPIVKTEDLARKRVAGCPYRVYVLDDEMAIKIDGDNMEVIGEGEYITVDPTTKGL